MNFTLRFAFWCVLARVTRPHTILEKKDMENLFALEPENTFSQSSDLLSQDSDLLSQDSDSLFQDSDSLTQNSDSLFPSDNLDIALQPLDQSSATTCDETQNSLNLFLDSPTSLNARDLADELPGFNEFVAPLNQLQDSTCVAPQKSPKSGPPSRGGGNQPMPWIHSDLLSSAYDYSVTDDGACWFMGVVSTFYPLALCCDGVEEVFDVHGCDYCKFLNI